MCVLAVKMGRREDLGYPQPSAPSPPRRASRAAYGYEYGYEWYGYAYQGLWYAYCATMVVCQVLITYVVVQPADNNIY